MPFIIVILLKYYNLNIFHIFSFLEGNKELFPAFRNESGHNSMGCGNNSLHILQLVSRRYSIFSTYCYLLLKKC